MGVLTGKTPVHIKYTHIHTHSILYTICKEKMAKVSRKLSQTMLAKRTQNITGTALGPQPREKRRVTRSHICDSFEPLALALDWPCRVYS